METFPPEGLFAYPPKPGGPVMTIAPDISTDLVTPLGAYLRLRREGRAAFLLESVERGRLGRHSLVGSGSRLCYLPEAEACGEPVVGYLAYDYAARLEPTVPLPDESTDLPESRFLVADVLIRFDHVLGTAEVIRGDPEAVSALLAQPVPRPPQTTARGEGDAERLLASEKDRAEHVMLVDLGRNDLSRVCLPGTVEVERFLEVERYSHVTHLVSQVAGDLRDGVSSYDLLRACFPAGTVSGAPKVRAMQLISELEGHRRGPYAGAVGYALPDGTLDTCITIRTIVLRDGVAHLQAGAGIVADSDPAAEHEECLRKLAAVEAAIDLAEAEQR